MPVSGSDRGCVEPNELMTVVVVRQEWALLCAAEVGWASEKRVCRGRRGNVEGEQSSSRGCEAAVG